MALQLVYKSAEVKLTQFITELRVQPAGWTALHFHLDQLLDEYKSEYQVKIAVNLINDLLKNYDGQLFLMVDSSILVLCKGLEPLVQEKLVFQLRYLYMDDPLSYTESGLENPEFVSTYDIKNNWLVFSEMCGRYLALVTRRQQLPPVFDALAGESSHTMITDIDKSSMPVLEKKKQNYKMSASGLAELESKLRVTELQAALRRQPICAVYADGTMRKLYEEIYINIAHLRRLMGTNIDFFSNRWLFHYMTDILDLRMMELICLKPSDYFDTAISLNLNVETLLSSEFGKLDALIPEGKKLSIVIEIPVMDAFANMSGFRLVVNEMQQKGYRICLDGMGVASFSSINRDALGVNLLKVQWNGETVPDLKNIDSPMRDAVMQAGSKRVILCRCDNKSAIEYGRALGISLFQGRYIDSVVNPSATVEN